MQAIILAAGMGRRLKELTQNNTKCMVKVNGVTLIDRMLHQDLNRRDITLRRFSDDIDDEYHLRFHKELRHDQFFPAGFDHKLHFSIHFR